jgi:pyridoxamine 5'-phosphate oxidase family protein
MSVFTPAEVRYLSSQSIARLATASRDGLPDVAAVGFSLDGDDIISGGWDLTKTVRYRHLSTNPRARIVIDDLASTDPFTPRGIKVRGPATLEDPGGSLRIRIRPTTIWSWGINRDAPTHSPGSRSARFPPSRPVLFACGPTDPRFSDEDDGRLA